MRFEARFAAVAEFPKVNAVHRILALAVGPFLLLRQAREAYILDERVCMSVVSIEVLRLATSRVELWDVVRRW